MRDTRSGRARGCRKSLLLQVDDFQRGGLEQHVLDVAKRLRGRAWSVELLVCGHADPDALDAARAIVPVHRLGRRLHGWRYAWRLRRTGATVVSAHHSNLGAEVARQMGRAFVQTVHNAYVWLSPAERGAYTGAEPFTSCYVVFSEFAREYAVGSLRLDPGRMRLVSPGIDLDRLRPAPDPSRRAAARSALGVREDETLFLNAASVCRPKAQLAIVEAAGLLRDRGARFRVVLAGAVRDAPYHHAVKRRLAERRLEDRVTLLGFREDVDALFQAADVFLQPSFVEGAGLALIEALSCGLPAIATAVGSAPTLLRGDRRHRLLPTPYASILDVNAANFAAELDRADATLPPAIASAMEELLPQGLDTRRPRFDLGLEPLIDAYEDIFSTAAAGPRPASAPGLASERPR